MTFEQKVHDTIMGILSTTRVPVVSFRSSDGSAFVGMTLDEVDTILPTQAETNIEGYVFEEHPSRLESAYKAQISHTLWRAIVVFKKQVNAETLLENFSRTVGADGAQRQFDLRLTNVDVENPPRNDPKNGTFLNLSIEVHPAPAL